MSSIAPKDVFPGNSEVAQLMRDTAWTATPLGPAEGWHQSLRLALSICLGSRFPAALFWGADLVLLYNDACAALLGPRHPKWLGQPARNGLPEACDAIAKAMQRGETASTEVHLSKHDGKGHSGERHLIFDCSPVQGDDSVEGVFCAITETIGTRHGRRAALVGNGAEGERDPYAGLLEALGVAVYSTDADGLITYYNEEAVEIWGRKPELGAERWCGSWRILHPDGTLMPHEECPMATALKEDRPVRGHEAIAERPDGSQAWFTPYPTPLHDAAGNLIGAVNVLVDITERKEAELALRESERRLDDFFETSAIALHWVGPNGMILKANNAELRMLGYTEDEYVGHNIKEFHTDRHVINDIMRRLANDEVIRDYEARLTRKDGSIMHVLIDSSVLWRNSEFVHTRSFTRDITEHKRAEENLRRNYEDLERFNRLAVDRELRMIELKKQINDLAAALGQPARYRLESEDGLDASPSTPVEHRNQGQLT